MLAIIPIAKSLHIVEQMDIGAVVMMMGSLAFIGTY